MLDALRRHVFDSVLPARIVMLTKLGDEREFIVCEDLVKWFFSYFDFPKLRTVTALRDAIARGATDTFGYVPSAEVRDGTLAPRREGSVWFGEPLPVGEVDLGPGAFSKN